MKALAVMTRESPVGVVDVPDPDPGPGQVRVAVEAASINGIDVAAARGDLWDHLPHTFPVVIGRDFGGSVESLGTGVEEWAVGDPVAGVITAMELGLGPIAEHITLDAASLVRRPDGVTPTQAAAVGLAGVTALDMLSALSLGDGDTVLVSGATGGVGAFAVQLAVATGAQVIATARPGEATDFVRQLGAKHVVDFTEDLAAQVKELAPEGVTGVLHAAGDPTTLGGVLASGGHLVSVVGATADQVGREDVSVTGILASYSPEKFESLLSKVSDGSLHVPVGDTFPLAKADEALETFAGGKLGKIVVLP